MSEFIFGEVVRGEDEFLALLPNLETKMDVFKWYASNLLFPTYFGYNWDAFDECIKDLSWIKESDVLIYHSQLPLRLYPSEQRTYLSILADAIKAWREDGSHMISVMFPASLRSDVERAML